MILLDLNLVAGVVMVAFGDLELLELMMVMHPYRVEILEVL